MSKKIIKRVGGQWTTIQCLNCKNCYKVLTGKFALTQQCPYCLMKIDLYDTARAAVDEGSIL